MEHIQEFQSQVIKQSEKYHPPQEKLCEQAGHDESSQQPQIMQFNKEVMLAHG